MFKAGERVWHIRFGWGALIENIVNSNYPLHFKSDGVPYITALTLHGFEGNTDINPVIFYKPQTFDMSKPEPEIGTWGYFWDEGKSNTAAFSKLSKILDSEYKYELESGVAWKHFSPDIPPHIKELMNGTNTDNP